MGIADPDIEKLMDAELKKIHQARFHHCMHMLLEDLILNAREGAVDMLDKYSACILPGGKLGLLYPEGVAQVMVEELKAATERLAAPAAAVPAAPAEVVH